jgi:hypothetical protein
VHLDVGADFLKYFGAICSGAVYYDQRIKMELAGTAKPKIKKRSQFLKIGPLSESWKELI